MIKNIIDKEALKKGASNAVGGCLVTLAFATIVNPLITPILKPFFSKLGKKIGSKVNGEEKED